MWSSQQRTLLTMRRGLVAMRSLTPQNSALLSCNEVSALVIVAPAFAPQHFNYTKCDEAFILLTRKLFINKIGATLIF